MKSRTPQTNGVKELLIGTGRHVDITGEITRSDRPNFGGIALTFSVFPMARKTRGQIELFAIGVIPTFRCPSR
jgi:hypothetical protein